MIQGGDRPIEDEIATDLESDREGASANDLREVVQSLFSDENINLKTVLNAEQVVALAGAIAFGMEYRVDLILDVARLLMQLKVSEKARGRNDMAKVLQSFLGRGPQDEMKEYERTMR